MSAPDWYWSVVIVVVLAVYVWRINRPPAASEEWTRLTPNVEGPGEGEHDAIQERR